MGGGQLRAPDNARQIVGEVVAVADVAPYWTGLAKIAGDQS